MKYISMTEAPLELYGIEVICAEAGVFHRLPAHLAESVSAGVARRAKNPAGGRVRFMTDADVIAVAVEMHENSLDKYIPLCGSVGVDVYVGTGAESRFRGVVEPQDYGVLFWERNILLRLPGQERELRQVTVNLPRNHPIKSLRIGFPEDARVLSPLPYSMGGRICYYGSSITEGGCASRPGNAYTAAVSRLLDTDYVNYGFSGSACGEIQMADIIGHGEWTAVVMDYDHNAYDADALRASHEPFFKRLREHFPTTPIIIMSKPDFFRAPSLNGERREIIRATYESAVAAGDGNVYFIDGETFFADEDINACTVDMSHPTDYGFACMTRRVYGVLKNILK